VANLDLGAILPILQKNSHRQRLYWEYYRGEQPLLYVSKAVHDYFRERSRQQLRFVENWVAVVVEAVLERIHLKNVSHPNPAIQRAIRRIRSTSMLPQVAHATHELALATGVAYVVIWPNADRVPQIYYQKPGLMTGIYDEEDATRLTAAVKWWQAADGRVRLTLYTPEAIYRYVTHKPISDKSEFNSLDARSFVTLRDPEPNPLGVLPVVPFQTRLDEPRAEFDAAAPIQDMLNKTTADMMVTGEWGAFPQRWVVTHADLSNLKSTPAGLWEIPAGLSSEGEPTKVGQFDPADLANYTRVIEHFIGAISAISRIPSYYLRTSGDIPSGEALRLMDNVLASRAQTRIESFTASWQRAFQIALAFAGHNVAASEDIEVTFASPSIDFPDQTADARQKNRAAGLPLKTILREEGKPEEFLQQMERDMEEEREFLAATDSMTQLLQDLSRGEE